MNIPSPQNILLTESISVRKIETENILTQTAQSSFVADADDLKYK